MIKQKSKFKPFNFVINIFFLFMLVCFITPLLLIVSASFSDEASLAQFGYGLIPKGFSYTAYAFVFKSPGIIINAYIISILVTAVGTVLSLLITSALSYGISRKDYRYRNITSFLVFFTMLFNGGLVPWYILISQYLHLKNTVFALVLPYMVNAWYVLVMKGFMQGLSMEIFESAKIDGASEYRIFFKIVLPLSKPGLATVGLFIALMYWNDWWLGLLFIEKNNLVPIQLLLQRIMNNIEFLTSGLSKTIDIDYSNFPNESARMAMCVMAAGPMMFVFPFFQKYFVKGLTIGAVKG